MKIAVVGTLADSLVNFRGPMIQEFIRRGHQVDAMAARTDELGGLVGDIEPKLRGWGAEPIWYPLERTGMNPVQDLKSLLALYKIFRNRKPDLVLCYTVKAVIYGSIAAKLARVPKIYSMITGLTIGLRTQEDQESRRGKIMATLYRLALSSNAGVIFQNPDDEKLFKDLRIIGANKPTARVNGSGVDLSHYPPSPLPKGPTKFLMIARLLRDKGVVEYLEAAKIVKVSHPECTFTLVGPFDPHPMALTMDDLRPYIESQIVSYEGSQQDVRPYLQACTVYVLPSYREGTPRTVLEALASGRPVITTDAPGCRQTVEHDRNGLLVPVQESGALATAMVRLIENPDLLQTMASASLEKAKSFDVESVNQAICNIIGL